MNIRYLNSGVVAAMAVWGSLNTMAADNTTTTTPSSSSTAPATSSSTVSGSTSTSSKLAHADTAFIKDAAQGGLAEVEMGRMVASQAQDAQVKQLGQRLVQDHGSANQELTQIAQQNGVMLPNDTSRKDGHMESKLHGKTGADFDKAFVEHALTDHEKDIRKFQKASQDVKDPQLKAWIDKNLPVLRQHLEMARTAGASVGVDQKALTAADRFLSEQGSRNQGLGTSGSTESGRATSSTPDRSSAATHGTTSHDNSTPGQTK